jgi:hypothetical protein
MAVRLLDYTDAAAAFDHAPEAALACDEIQSHPGWKSVNPSFGGTAIVTISGSNADIPRSTDGRPQVALSSPEERSRTGPLVWYLKWSLQPRPQPVHTTNHIQGRFDRSLALALKTADGARASRFPAGIVSAQPTAR